MSNKCTGACAAVVLLGISVAAFGTQSAPTPASKSKSLTIRKIFSTPGITGYSPRNLQWSRNGEYLAFMKGGGKKSGQNLYILNTHTGKRHLLISAATPAPDSLTNPRAREAMMRYHLSNYGWTYSGDAIYLLKGNRIRLYAPAGGSASRAIGPKLEQAQSPSVAPGKHFVAWVSNHMLYYASTATNAKPVAVTRKKPHTLVGATAWVYREELGLEQGYAWSHPDGRYLAFLKFNNQKVTRFPIANYLKDPPSVYWEHYPRAGEPNPIATLGIRDTRSSKTKWIHLPGATKGYISRFGWLEKGHTLYAEVLNRPQTQATLYLINPATGSVHQLARHTDPWWIQMDATPRFLPNGDFIWSSTKDNWHHLYLYNANGHLLRKLTSGSYNARLAGVNAKQGYAYFTRYTDGSLNTELYRTSLDGGSAKAVTTKPGVHYIDMSRHGGHYIDTYSRAGTPPVMTLFSTTSHHATVLKQRPDLSAYHLKRPRFFKITAADGKTKLDAELMMPAHFDPHKKYPVIMYQYGGPDVPPEVRDGWGGSDYLFDLLLNRAGFAVFVVDNRAAAYFSHRAQSIIKDDFGQAELADQVAAAKWLKKQPWVDPKRVGIWGWSFGGYMTAYELTHAPKVWRAGISVAPVTRWRYYDTTYTERYMGTPQKDPKGYKKASVVNAAKNLQRPLMIAAGTDDDNVHWQNTLSLVQALIHYNKPYRLFVFPNKSHGISGTAARTQLFTSMLDFWVTELQGKVHTGH